MANPRLSKKERKNKLNSALRKARMKMHTFKPVLRSVNVDEIKKGFKNRPKTELTSTPDRPQATPK